MKLIDLLQRIELMNDYDLNQIGLSPFTEVEEEKNGYNGTLFMGWDGKDESFFNRVVVRGKLENKNRKLSKLVLDIEKLGLLDNYYFQSFINNDSMENRMIFKLEKNEDSICVAVIYPLGKSKDMNKYLDYNNLIKGEYDNYEIEYIQFDHKRTYMGAKLIFEI